MARPLNISIEKISLYFVFVFFIVLTFFSREIPFFWDGLWYSQISHYYYNNNFSSLLVPADLDHTGSPLIYWTYLALIWEFFGKTLLVSHLAVLPFLLGITWEYYKLAKRFLSDKMIPWAMLLLLLEPTVITQSILMGYDISQLYFFLLALNALLQRNGILYSFSFFLLTYCSVRGVIMGFSLFLIHLLLLKFFAKKNFFHEMKWYIMPGMMIVGWMVWHYYKVGWVLFSPNPNFETYQKFCLSPIMMFRKCIYVLWQIADFGRILIWMFIGAGIYYFIKRKRISEKLHILVLIVLCPFMVFAVFFALHSTPVGHRYFLNIFLCSLILFCYVLQEINFNKKIKYTAMAFLCIGLITGNFWLYGGGFSNGWDSSLKVLPYFKLKNEMDDFVKEQNINEDEVGTKFPLYHDKKYSDFASESFHYAEIDTTSMYKFKFILFSNVSNQFTVDEKKKLNSNWILMKEFSGGQVYLRLFKNPNTK